MSGGTDLPGGTSTSAILGLGIANAISSCLELANGDVDYIRFEAEYGKVYDVVVSFDDIVTQPVYFELLDYRGWVVQKYLRFGDHLITPQGFSPFPFSGVSFSPHYTGSYYLRVSGAVDVGYTATGARRVNDMAGQPVEILGLGISSDRIDELETASDDDRFSVVVKAGRRYFLDVFGADTGQGTLADPWVGIQLPDRTYYDDNSGSGRNAFLSFVPAVDGFHYVVVGGTGTGTYHVALHVEDDFAGNATTSGRVQPGRSVRGDISQANDIDWFRVLLQSGRLYRFRLEGMDLDSLNAPLMILRDPGLKVVALNAVWQPGSAANGLPVTEFFFQANLTGDHFAIARSVAEDLLGDYRLSVDHVRPPIFRKFQTPIDAANNHARFYKVNDQIIPMQNLFHTGSFAPARYQLYSSVSLHRQGTPQPASKVLTLPAQDLALWQLSSAFEGRADILIRAETGGNWSEWLSTPVYGMTGLPQLLSGNKWNDPRPVRYEYVSELPSYFAGVYSGFQAIDKGGSFDATVNGVRNATASWGRAVVAEVDAVQSQGQIRIFLADNVSGYLDAFVPGPDSGGDIVLNKQFFRAGSAFEIPSITYVELLRALGQSLGLSDGTGLTRSQSVMTLNGSADEPYSWTPTRHDLLAIRTLYGLDDSLADQLQYSTDRGTGFRGTTTSAFETNFNEVMKFKSGSMPRRMDLRPGSESFEIEDGRPINRILTGWETQFQQATGSTANDVIFGNGLGNLILGEAGSDYLEGREGNDSLRGGSGSDWYGYTFGGGHDNIQDNFVAIVNPGNDTLRAIGWDKFRLDNLSQNFSFQRLGNDLNVYLALDGGPAEGSIRIENMANSPGRIESLELFHDRTRTARISLGNLFSQLASEETRRFRISAGSDSFGQLVVPF